LTRKLSFINPEETIGEAAITAFLEQATIASRGYCSNPFSIPLQREEEEDNQGHNGPLYR
jgi:hypothetical protein